MTNATENMDLIKQAGISSYESARALGELNLRTWEQLAEQQLATFNYLLDTGIKQIKLTGEVKELGSLVSTQAELSREFSEEMSSRGKQFAELSKQAGESYREWFEKGVATLRKTADVESA
jgi:hypothetical protein